MLTEEVARLNGCVVSLWRVRIVVLLIVGSSDRERL